MTLGERIKAVRAMRGISQREVGEKCGIADSTIRRYELDRLNPKYETLQKIADVLDVPVSYFLQSEMCYISQDLQKLILNKIRERIDGVLLGVDAADFFEAFGTYDMDVIFGDIYDGKSPLTKERLEDAADALGVSFDYLIGFTDDPFDSSGEGE